MRVLAGIACCRLQRMVVIFCTCLTLSVLPPTTLARTCSLTTDLAFGLYDLYTSDCATDRSQCEASSIAECRQSEVQVATTLQDGCNYFFNDGNGNVLGVNRKVQAAATNTFDLQGFPVWNYLLGFYHVVFQGTVNQPVTVAIFQLTFEPNSGTGNPEDVYFPKLGGYMSAKFNGQACDLIQVWCNEVQTSYNFLVDCSMYDGGAVVNMCSTQPLTTESSLMEFALWSPFFSCADPLAFLPQPEDTPIPTNAPTTATPTPNPTNAPSSGAAVGGASFTVTPIPTSAPTTTTPTPNPTNAPSSGAAAVGASFTVHALILFLFCCKYGT